MNIAVYGMTKGQQSPTTAPDWNSKIAPGGAGFNPLQPLAVALAAGASFIARGFSGDPNGIAHLLVEAIRHPGFALVQVLSPCVTYRPEEKAWKQEVHAAGWEPATDPAEAARRLFADDGLSTGIFYRGRPSPHAAARRPASRDLTAIESAFVL